MSPSFHMKGKEELNKKNKNSEGEQSGGNGIEWEEKEHEEYFSH